MPCYESLFIVRPSLTDEETTAVIEKVTGMLEKLGASLFTVENWGKRKLAYEVEHDRRGTYVLLQFQAEGKVMSELERFYRLEDAVLKFLTVKVDEAALRRPASKAGTQTESDGGGVQ
ncbi:MAG: 30S ribosomal protein S6 [Nitrospirae bacterium]|nr:MAG: 30S ribosomal protein S6 [Nitrospirota bacterium]